MPLAANSPVIPSITAAAFLRQFGRVRVHAARVNNTWRSALARGGDTVTISQDLEGSVGDYRTVAANRTQTEGTRPLTSRDLGDVTYPAETLTLNRVKFWQVTLDDIDAARSSLPLLTAAVSRHADAMALQVDADVKASMVSGATNISARVLDHNKLQTLTPSTANNQALADAGLSALGIAKLHRRMDLQRIPREGRWVIVGPFTAEYLQALALKTERFVVATTTQDLVNGRIGTFGGFTWYVDRTAEVTMDLAGNSGNVNITGVSNLKYTEGGVTVTEPRGTGTGNPGATETWIAGVDSATAFIDRVRRTERYRSQASFADVVRGLYEYGSKVIDYDFRGIANSGTARKFPRLFECRTNILNLSDV